MPNHSSAAALGVRRIAIRTIECVGVGMLDVDTVETAIDEFDRLLETGDAVDVYADLSLVAGFEPAAAMRCIRWLQTRLENVRRVAIVVCSEPALAAVRTFPVLVPEVPFAITAEAGDAIEFLAQPFDPVDDARIRTRVRRVSEERVISPVPNRAKARGE